jgi:hypothetical protein
MGSDGDFEYGRPRYQPAPAPDSGRPRQLGDGPAGSGPQGEPEPVLAPSAVVALVIAVISLLLPLLSGISELRRGAFALIGFLLPLFGGLYAVRRGTAALRTIQAGGGAFTGTPAAVWARRLGWLNVLVSAVLLFYRFGGPLFQQLYSSAGR